MNEARETRLVIVLVVLRLVAAGWFAVSTPLYEKADELNHYRYARFIAREHRLPSAADETDLTGDLAIYSQYEQPPLYYLMLAPLAALDDSSPDKLDPIPNPYPQCEVPFRLYYVHGATTGSNNAVWLARLLTMLIGAASVVVLWMAARLLWSEQVALLAAAILALMPAAAELTAWLNNDALLMLLGALLLYFLARYRRDAHDRAAWVGMGITVILCAATKLTGLVALPVVIGAVALRSGSPRRLTMIAVVLVILTGGFVAFNLWHCDSVVCRIYHSDPPTVTSGKSFTETLWNAEFTRGYSHLLRSAAVPWINADYPPTVWMLIPVWLVFAGGLIGAVIRMRTEKNERGFVMLLFAVMILAVGLAHARVWWIQDGYMPVRYAALAIPAFALLVALGTDRLARTAKFVPAIAVFMLAGVSLLAPVENYRPVFVLPSRLDDLPENAIALDDFRYESGVQIGAYAIAGDTLTLYMRAQHPTDEPLFVQVVTLNPIGRVLEGCGLIAGNAMWTTLDWRLDEWVRQDFPLETLQNASQLEIRFYGMLNNHIFVNSYDADHADNPVNTGRIALK